LRFQGLIGSRNAWLKQQTGNRSRMRDLQPKSTVLVGKAPEPVKIPQW
jgi:hypothetical protein